MKNICKYVEIYIMTLIIVISAILFVIYSYERYNGCEFYLGYSVESDGHNVILWTFNDDDIYKYCSYVDYSEQYHTSLCTLDDKVGKINDMRLCFDSDDGNISIAVLTIVCNGYSIDYYPQEILEKFIIQNAVEYGIDDKGVLQIAVNNQDCMLIAKEIMCEEINEARK